MYPREIESQLLENISNNRALFILGARRTGKTTLMHRLQDSIKDENTLFFDLEKQDVIQLFKQGVDRFVKYLDDQGFSDSERVIVFIDEIQYLDEFSNFVKLAVDHYPKRLKLILSGSSAAQIKYKFRDSLIGRKFIYRLHPLSFREFIIFKNEDRISELLGTNYNESQTGPIMRSFGDKIIKLYLEFILFGGFPEVVITQSEKGKKEILLEMIQTYVLKDIRNLFTIERISEFNHLVHLLALQSGQLFKKENVSIETKLNFRTLERYIQILTDSYLVQPIKPLFRNKLRELRKMPKIYIHDTGLRNSLINNFNPIRNRTDVGELLESAVFSALWKQMEILDELYFWRTTDGKEVDFVIQKGMKYIPFEVKIKRAAVNHLRFFSKHYLCSELNLVRLNMENTQEYKDIQTLPAWVL